MRRHKRLPAQLLASLLVVALVGVFTPCCELLAGLVAGAPADGAEQSHGHGAGDGHDEAPGVVCATTLDAALLRPDLMSGWNPPVVAMVPPAVSLSLSYVYPAAVPRTALRPRASGPPLYLRYAHLLI